MSRFTCRRSYKQLIAERNAMEEMIQRKKSEYFSEIKAQNEGTSKGYTPVRLAREIESDEALLAEINKDIESAKEKM